MHLLIDQDGVLADFEAAALTRWREQYPEEFFCPPEQRRTFYMRDDYPPELRQRLSAIYEEPGFYRSLPVILGSVAALAAMQALGHQVTICTSPLSENPTCMNDKFQWVAENFGLPYAQGMVIVGDKTVIRGDILIDDRPQVTGQMSPMWEHVLYDRPYNIQVSGQRRLTWENWRQILKL